MKNLLLLTAVLFITVFLVECKGQPKEPYEIYGGRVPTATKYMFFLEKKSANPYKLIQGMDWVELGSDTSTLKLGTASDTLFTKELNNDGSIYKVGIVAVNAAGYYGAMSTGIDTVGVVPGLSPLPGLRKKR